MKTDNLIKQEDFCTCIEDVSSSLKEFVQNILVVQDKLGIVEETLSIVEKRTEKNVPEYLLFTTVIQYLGDVHSDLETLADVIMNYSSDIVEEFSEEGCKELRETE